VTFLLDTNACIRLLNQKDAPLARKLASIPRHEVALCSITKAELYYGAAGVHGENQSWGLAEVFSGICHIAL
jgi:tRNA(fMet)-specific endonuclease VapC